MKPSFGGSLRDPQSLSSLRRRLPDRRDLGPETLPDRFEQNPQNQGKSPQKKSDGRNPGVHQNQENGQDQGEKFNRNLNPMPGFSFQKNFPHDHGEPVEIQKGHRSPQKNAGGKKPVLPEQACSRGGEEKLNGSPFDRPNLSGFPSGERRRGLFLSVYPGQIFSIAKKGCGKRQRLPRRKKSAKTTASYRDNDPGDIRSLRRWPRKSPFPGQGCYISKAVCTAYYSPWSGRAVVFPWVLLSSLMDSAPPLVMLNEYSFKATLISIPLKKMSSLFCPSFMPGGKPVSV